MRPRPEIHTMRDQLFVRWATTPDETGVDEIRTTLAWVLDPSIPDSELFDLIEPADDDEDGPDPAEVLDGLPELLRADDLIDAKDYLMRASEGDVTALAAAARRLDRLCKAELKKRNPQ